MVKQFTVNCNFKTTKAPVTFYIGDPSDDNNPVHFQAKWLGEKKGGTIPKEVTDSFAELQKVSAKNHISFQELCGFVIEELKSNEATIVERNRIHKNLTIIQKREQQKQLTSATEHVANAPVALAQNLTTDKNDEK